MTIKINETDVSRYFLDGRIKFDRPEGAIGHSEAVLDFYKDKAVVVSRGDNLEITTDDRKLYFIVEKITDTKDSSKKRIVAKDAIYFKKDMPLPAVVFVDVPLSEVCQWVADKADFELCDIVPDSADDPHVPFYFVEDDRKLSDVLREIAESVQGRVFSDITDTITKGEKIRFQFASLKTYSSQPLMSLTEDQISTHEISDLPRQYNTFTLKFKEKKQIQDSLVFRGASYEDVFSVKHPGYPEDDNTIYYVEFENPVIKVTDHSFDARDVVIDEATWRSNIRTADTSDANYGTLNDPYKMQMKFLCENSLIGGDIYDFRIYGTAIKQDDMSETIDVSDNDFKRSKEISSAIISTELDWHKSTLAWLASKKAEKHKFTVVDPAISFVDMMNLKAESSLVKDNTIVNIEPFKIDIFSTVWNMGRNKWDFEGYTARSSDTTFDYIEKMKSGDILDKTQKKLITTFERKHPNLDTPENTIQLVEIPTTKKIENYDVEIEPVYMKGTTNTAKYLAFNRQRGMFEFEAYAGEPPLAISDIGIRLSDSVLANSPSFGEYSRIFYPNPADVTTNSNNGRILGGFTAKFYRKSDNGYVGEYSEPLTGYWSNFKCSFTVYNEGGETLINCKCILSGFKAGFGEYRLINDKNYNASELYVVIDTLSLQPVNYEPLQGRFRFKIFQDVNKRLGRGIMMTCPLPSSGSDSIKTINIQTVSNGSIPSFDSEHYELNETYTSICFQTSGLTTLKTVVLRNNSNNSYIEAVAYKFSTYDNYKYFDYKYENDARKTIKFYDPDNLVEDVVLSPK